MLTTPSQPCWADGVTDSYASHCRTPEGDVRTHRDFKTHKEHLKEKNSVEAHRDVGKHLETCRDAWSRTIEETAVIFKAFISKDWATIHQGMRAVHRMRKKTSCRLG